MRKPLVLTEPSQFALEMWTLPYTLFGQIVLPIVIESARRRPVWGRRPKSVFDILARSYRRGR